MEERGVRSRAPAFLAVARYGTKYVRRTRLFWVFVIASWIPTLFWAVMIYAAEETGVLDDVSVAALAAGHASEYRQFVSDRAMLFLQIQALAVTFVAALAGGGAIAEDARRHAFELYFSRPISALTYAFGKWFYVASRLLLVLLYPMLILFGIAFALIPGFASNCWPVLLSASAAACFMSGCYAVVVLGVSASVRTARYAVVFWFIIAFFTVVASLILVQITGETGFEAVSFRFAIEHVASWMLGARLEAVPIVDADDRSLALSASVLGLWLLGGAALIARRLGKAAGT